ncbi:hypothetical protein [Argonema galeatum]|nr:hypothetical protein [Argonema galeatum]MCL1465431.1 hypothetical protein [Argonema galeatum A003/A1]
MSFTEILLRNPVSDSHAIAYGTLRDRTTKESAIAFYTTTKQNCGFMG